MKESQVRHSFQKTPTRRRWNVLPPWWNARPRWQRLLAVCCFVPGAAMATGATLYYLDMHRQDQRSLPTQIFPTPQTDQRYLVVAPHCDDETLALGGLMADARDNNIPVSVAFLTNGDGFRVAASKALEVVNPTPADFVRFGELRQGEATKAMEKLGISRDRLAFLGYPDRGMQSLWEKYWDAKSNYVSAFTHAHQNPYKTAYHPQASYSGQSVVQDIVTLIKQEKPTDIFVTHPADDHPDHSAAPNFVQAALETLQKEKDPLVTHIRLHYYIVHRGDWPLPQGHIPDQLLLPPMGMQQKDTQWSTYPLSSNAIKKKTDALQHYASQTHITGRFLWSFIRKNEIIGAINTPTLQDINHSVRLQDATGDNWVRYSNPSADITGILVKAEPNGLRVRITTKQAVSPLFRYQISVHRPLALSGPPASPISPTVSHALSASNNQTLNAPYLETNITWKELGMQNNSASNNSSSADTETLWIGAETRWATNNFIDRTGYRPVIIPASLKN
jgi:LmbE family N-acetylglucosaminyl deacetylase